MQLLSLTSPALHRLVHSREAAKRRGQKVRRITDVPVCFPLVTAAIMANPRPQIICFSDRGSGSTFQICPGMFWRLAGIFSVAVPVFLVPGGFSFPILVYLNTLLL